MDNPITRYVKFILFQSQKRYTAHEKIKVGLGFGCFGIICNYSKMKSNIIFSNLQIQDQNVINLKQESVGIWRFNWNQEVSITK